MSRWKLLAGAVAAAVAVGALVPASALAHGLVGRADIGYNSNRCFNVL